jgi:hypothetical protein
MTLVVTSNPALSNDVFDVLKEFANARRLFSAYDVTKEVRQRRNAPPFIAHEDVRDLVHSAYNTELPPFENGSDYVREDYSHQKGHNLVQFQVYRPIERPLTDYNTVGDFSAPAPKPAAMPTPAPVIGCSPLIFPAANIDKRGRLCVSNLATRTLAANPGDIVSIWADSPSGGYIVQEGNLVNKLGPELLGYLKVDKDGNVRISRWMVEAMSLTSGANVSYMNSEIVLS